MKQILIGDAEDVRNKWFFGNDTVPETIVTVKSLGLANGFSNTMGLAKFSSNFKGLTVSAF